MKYDPVKYKRFDREPIGKFEAQIQEDGWGQTRYVNNTSSVLLSIELSEFIRVVEDFFKENADWQKLQKFAKKYCTKIISTEYGNVDAVNILGDRMDYTINIIGATLIIFPYRKYQH